MNRVSKIRLAKITIGSLTDMIYASKTLMETQPVEVATLEIMRQDLKALEDAKQILTDYLTELEFY